MTTVSALTAPAALPAQPVPTAPDRGPATITRIVPTGDLPEGVGAVANDDGSTIFVSSALDRAGRRRAFRLALAAAHRSRRPQPVASVAP
jgi:hypothetical protein